MREGIPAAIRSRLASPVTVLVLGCVVLALVAAEWPFASLAHRSAHRHRHRHRKPSRTG